MLQLWSVRTCLPCLLVLCLLCLPLPSLAQAPSVQLITQVERLRDRSETPPPAAAAWESLELPLGDVLSDPANRDAVFWFRLQLERPGDTVPRSLYFFRYNRLIDVWFNGYRIGGDTRVPGRHTQAWNHPLLVNLQPGSWRDGPNEVLIRFEGTWLGGAFYEFAYGATAELEREHELRYFRQQTLNHWVLMFGLFGCCLALLLWLQRRQDSLYLLFAGASACSVVVATHMVIYHNPLPYHIWLVLVHVAIDVWVNLLYRFLQELLQLRSPRGNRLMTGILLLSLAWHLLMLETWWWTGAYVLHFAGLLCMLVLLGRIFAMAWHQPRSLAAMVSLVVLVQAAFFIRDAWVVMSVADESWRSAFHISLFTFPLMQLVFLVTLVQRFVQALDTAEELNRELEDKVEASRRIIEQSFHEKRLLELEQATDRERANIYRELHDDVGSKLLSIVHAGRDTRMGLLAATALESLRDAVSRANYPEQRLAAFLHDLREETELRLKGSGHEVQWRQPPQLPELTLSSQQAFHLNRIFKEVVSNIIRHASARKVLVIVSQDESSWQFLVNDDGTGFSTAAPCGNGIRNLSARAEEIGAAIAWRSAPAQGTTVSVTVQLDKDRPGAADPLQA